MRRECDEMRMRQKCDEMRQNVKNATKLQLKNLISMTLKMRFKCDND